MSQQSSCDRLAALRTAMAAADGGRGVHAYIVPTEDPHMSEYSPDCFKRREFISRFTGTAGTAVVTTEQALLWTDGRYFLQATQELSKQWTLMRAGTPGCPDLEDWLASNLPAGGRVGIDPLVHTVDSVRRLQRKLQDAGMELVVLGGGNLVDEAWGAARPAAPPTPLRVHPLEWAGAGVASKLSGLAGSIKAAKADLLVVAMLDEVAWLTNLRGADVAHNPVFLSYAAVSAEGGATLYVDAHKLSGDVSAHLKESGVAVRPYASFLPDVRAAAGAGQAVWLDPSKVSYAVYQAAKEGAEGGAGGDGAARKRARTADGAATTNGSGAHAAKVKVVELASPVVTAKAVKNDAEMRGMREAHLRDAAALAEFLCEMERRVGGGEVVSEVEVDELLTGKRAQQKGFLEPSFPTIAGAGPNGAIIHYRAQPGTCRSVDAATMLLLDSGGQYDCGTTDITRTMHFGTPTAAQKCAYTRVLQGHIALDQAVFPEGTPGCALDTLARLPLWREGLNYRHGTGHGVGAALNVHEGPISISARFHITAPLSAHMVVSNEPGYYEDGGFGVRIENLVAIREADTPHRFGGIGSLRFEALTLVPIQTKMVEAGIMTPDEVAWLDSYHARVWDAVSPRLAHSPDALEWLRKNTRPLAEQQGQE